jgi:glyoxylase-like metal-dependent hydrolase (beta-lactamase superfamily II)
VRITDEVFQVGGPPLTAPQDAAIYLLSFAGCAALIDAGCGRATEKLLENVSTAGVEPETIELLLLTHCHFDHTGGASALRERLHCTVVMHELDAWYVATSAGLKIVFAQDVHGPLHRSLLSNAADYQASLKRLIDLDADILCEGHYGIYHGRQEIVRFVSSFMR